jgi:sugar/nucleoside kinase (ribokinase family)
MLSDRLHGGCPGHNMSTALKRLEAPFPVEAIGLIGDDPDGRMLVEICDAFGIGRAALIMRKGEKTGHTLAMTSKASGKRTFFTTPGTHAVQTPDDFELTQSNARILHIGLPGLHEKLDAPWGDDVSGWVTVLKKARSLGFRTNAELVSIEPERIRHAAGPMLQWLDTLVINDHEAGALAGMQTVHGGKTDKAAVRQAAEAIMAASQLSLLAVHFPMGGIALTRNGETAEQPSVSVPRDEIIGSNGAGDAFAAGMLFGIHENWPLQQSLRLANASAATSLLSETTTGSILPWKDCLAQAEKWGWRMARAQD